MSIDFKHKVLKHAPLSLISGELGIVVMLYTNTSIVTRKLNNNSGQIGLSEITSVGRHKPPKLTLVVGNTETVVLSRICFAL